MKTMFSALGMKSSSAKERIWRSLTPFCIWNGKDSRVHSSGKSARSMRAWSACSWRACHSARSNWVNNVGTGVPFCSAAANISAKRAAMVLSLRFCSSCSRSSFIEWLQIEREVIVRDPAQHHRLEAVQIEEPIAFGIGDGGEERLPRIVAQHRQEPTQRCAPLTDMLLEGFEVSAQARRDLQDLDLLGRDRSVTGQSLTSGWSMRGIGHARIPGSVDPGVARDPARPVIEDDPLERLAHFERSADQPVRRGVAYAVHVDVALRIDDAGAELIDLRHMQRQGLQVCLFRRKEFR